jgi:hypothetical protein
LKDADPSIAEVEDAKKTLAVWENSKREVGKMPNDRNLSSFNCCAKKKKGDCPLLKI